MGENQWGSYGKNFQGAQHPFAPWVLIFEGAQDPSALIKSQFLGVPGHPRHPL